MKQLCNDCPCLLSHSKEGCMYCSLFEKNIYNQDGSSLDECNNIDIFEEQVLKKLYEFSNNGDTEVAHVYADEVLVAFIRRLDHNEIADAYEKVSKWYA